MKTLKSGLIGLGAMGRNHARVLSLLERTKFTGVYDPELGGGGFGAAEGFESAEALLRSGIDFCVIAAPTVEHKRLASMAADNGVAVLVEKPVAMTSIQAEEIVNLFTKRGLVGSVGHIERFNPATIGLKDKIESGLLGPLYQIATRRQGPFPERIRDVGVVMDLATHDIDLTRWVTNSEYEIVSAWVAHKSGRQNEDLVVATGRLSGDLTYSHHVNWLSPIKERLTVVTGEGGTLVADTLNADLYFYENRNVETEWQAMAVFRGVGEGDVLKYALKRREPLLTELETFRDAVLGLAPVAVPLSDGAMAVRVGEAMLQSAGTQSTVFLQS